MRVSLILVLFVAACGDDSMPPVDGGTDVATDAPFDTSTDALPGDTGLDSMPADSGLDALPMPPVDGGTDVATDAPFDTSTDALPGDTGLDSMPADSGLDALPSDTGLDSMPADSGLDALPSDSGLDSMVTDAGMDSSVMGEGMSCVVLGQYLPSDVASRGDDRWLAVLNRIVRTDGAFENAVEELVLAERVDDIVATTTEIMALTSSDRILRRADDGTWSDVTPGDLGSNPTLRGTSTLVLSDGSNLRRWSAGAWSSVALPGAVSGFRSGFTAYDETIYATGAGSIWIHDGSDWTETSLDPLGVVSGPPLPPVDQISTSAPEPTPTGLVFRYVVERTSGPDERGIATLEGTTFTKLTDAGSGRVRTLAGGGFITFMLGNALTSPDGTTWTEVGSAPASTSGRSYSLTLDDASTWLTVEDVGVYELDGASSWTRAHVRNHPQTLADVAPDSALSASAYGAIYDADTGESRLTTWSGASWEASAIEGPPGEDANIAWIGSTAYFLTIFSEESAALNRWTTAGNTVLPNTFHTNAFAATDAEVYITNRTGILTRQVLQLSDVDTWGSLPNISCSPTRLVAAGATGLVAVGCLGDGELFDDYSMWLDGGSWSSLAALVHIGHLGGPGGTAVFWNESAGDYPTYDGTAWSTWTSPTTSTTRYLDGDDTTFVAQAEGELVWQVGDETRTLDDPRVGTVLDAMVRDDRLVLRITPNDIGWDTVQPIRQITAVSYTYDCIPY